MLRRSFKARSENTSGRGLLLWSITGAVVVVGIVFVLLAQFSTPSSSAQPVWKNLVHTVTHPAQAIKVAKAKIEHKAPPTPEPTPTATQAPTPAPTTAPATTANKADAASLVTARKRAEVRKLAAAATTHKARASAATSTVSSSGANVASAGNGVPIAPIVPITPAPRRTPAPTAAPAETFVDAQLVHQGNADYPMMARDQGVQGTTIVLVSVTASGAVSSASVAQSSGNKLLDASALRAAYQSRFQPATRNGAPVASSARLVYTFSL
jgi:periplasmic protein TonB